jgi:hypothetical protein
VPNSATSTDMKTTVFVGVGAVLVLLGATWTLQGLDVIGGSAMSGVTLWAVVGPIVIIVGLVVALLGIRSRSAP